MVKKNSFTLIELLVVVVILGLIASVAVPAVINFISRANKLSFEQTINGLVRTIDTGIDVAKVEHEHVTGTYTIVDGEIVESNNFQYDGQLPKDGTFIIEEDGSIQIAIHNDKWCAIRKYGEDDYVVVPYDENCMVVAHVEVEENVYTDEACFTFNSTIGDISFTHVPVTEVTIPTMLQLLEL